MRFNFLFKQKAPVVNHEAAKAFVMTPEQELYTAVVTAGLSDTFYEASDRRIERIQQLMTKCDAEFISKLAIYTRNQMHLRSVSMVLLVELAKRQSMHSQLSAVVPQVVRRADEITELLAYYQLANNRTGEKKLNKLSKQLQKGLAISFNQFDEYQFAKYNRDAEIKLKDALFLVHPKPKDETQQVIFNKIAQDTLNTPYTWETELSAVGQIKFETTTAKQAAFTNVWETFIESGKLGYMALMRNLRNILEAGVSAKQIQIVCNKLTDVNAVLNSKQLPFRFLAAYRELLNVDSKFTSVLLDALETAIEISAQNIKGFGYDTSVLVACDVSGSMQKPISPKSKVQLFDIGLVLAMLMKNRCKNVITGFFGDRWKTIRLGNKNILGNVQEIYKREGEVGYSTNGYLVIDDLIKRNVMMDKVMLFSDVQMYDSSSNNNSLEQSWKRYKKISPCSKLYVFDLAGHGTSPLSLQRDDVYLIAGWSDKLFDILDAVEQGEGVLDKIKAINI